MNYKRWWAPLPSCQPCRSGSLRQLWVWSCSLALWFSQDQWWPPGVGEHWRNTQKCWQLEAQVDGDI
uniref:Uncharacterized protein n=1 Tax=Pavo cristatus TaxID=9049 RepID=A0A8C9FYG6_PAVCR